MSYPGEYPNPLPRSTNVQCTLTNGFAAARLSREDPLFFAGSGDDDNAQVHLENVGSTSFTVQMRQASETSPSGTESGGTPTGTRFDVGSATALVPGGHKTLNVSPYKQYLEFWCTSGRGELRVQLISRVRWQKMAFDKSETTVSDVTLWNVKPIPHAPNPVS